MLMWKSGRFLFPQTDSRAVYEALGGLSPVKTQSANATLPTLT